MKFLVSVTLLLTLGSCVDVWTPFLSEEGAEYDMNEFGVEFADNWSASKGGNGGGPWTEDCGCGGIQEISMECGKYVGMLKVKCGGRWKGEHGLGRGNGHGGHYSVSGVGITRVQINAGAYVDRIEFYKGGSMLRRCGWSNGGGRYSANAPAGMHLCGLSGRSGWWMDKLKAGWCYYKRDCKQSGFTRCDACNKSSGKKNCHRSVTQTPKCGGRACGASAVPHSCPVNCEVGGFSCGGCNKGNGLQACSRRVTVTRKNNGRACPGLTENRRCKVNCEQGGWRCSCNRRNGVSTCTRSVTVTAKNGGTACGASTKHVACARDCQLGGFGNWGRCSNYKQSRHRTIAVHPANGGNRCPTNTSEHRCCEMNGHRCHPHHQHQCCGNRCCSRWGWCGGSRDKKWDAWCGHAFDFLNHVAGFHSEVGDISVAFTGAFAAVIFLPTFAAYKFFSRQSEGAEYQALLNDV